MIAFLFCLAVQDDLLRQLGDDSAAARDEAERRLIESGGKNLPRLQKDLAEARDPEIKERLERIVRCVELQEALGEADARTYLATPPEERWLFLKPRAGKLKRRRFSPSIESWLASDVRAALQGSEQRFFALGLVLQHDIACLGCLGPECIDDPDAAVRLRAVEVAHRFKIRERLDRLVECLDDADPEVRLAAIDAVAALEGPRYVDRFKTFMSDPDENIRTRAVGALAQALTVKDASTFLNEGEPWARRAWVSEVRRLRLRDSMEVVAGLSSDPDVYVRREVLFAIAELGDGRFQDRMARFLDDPREEVQVEALRRSDLANAIAKKLDDGNPVLRQESVYALARLKSHPEAVAARLKDSNAAVRFAALSTLDIDRFAAQIGPLIADPSAWIRRAAFERLGTRADYLKALEDPDPDVRWCGVAIGSKAPNVPEVERLLKGADADACAAAMALLKEWGERDESRTIPESTLKALARLVDHESSRIRIGAAVTLIRFARDGMSLLGHSEEPIRQAAMEAVRRYGKPSDAAKLVEAVRRDDAENLEGVLDLLSTWNARAQAPFAAGCLKHESAHVRLAAIRALRGFAAKEHLDAVRPLADDPRPGVRALAAALVQEWSQ